MKKIFLLIIILTLAIAIKLNIYANSNEIIQSQLNLIDIDAFINDLKGLTKDNEYLTNFDLKETINKIVKGEFSFSLQDTGNNIIKNLLKEIYNQMGIIKNIIFIVCICAITKNLSSSFQSQAVAELSFYVSYIIVVIMLFQSFRVAVNLVSDSIDSVSTLLNVFLPVLTTLLITSGNYMSITMFHPVIIFTTEVMIIVIKNIILPIIFSTALLEIINHISAKELLTNLSELIKKTLGWILKSIAMLFTATLALHKLTVPVVEGVVNKTAKSAIGIIPVVGEVMTKTVDTIAGFMSLIKNGTILTVIIFMILLCTIPVLKLIALIFVYKFTAAIIQPISDERIVNCINTVGTFCQLLLGALVCVMVMFIFVAMIGISTVII